MKLRYDVWGSIVAPEVDGQLIKSFDSEEEANTFCEERNNEPKNHPDLAFWVSKEEIHKDNCYHNDPEAVQHGAPCTCDEPESTHTEMCNEYWDRGLECRCVPEAVNDAIRNGAKPEDVM